MWFHDEPRRHSWVHPVSGAQVAAPLVVSLLGSTFVTFTLPAFRRLAGQSLFDRSLKALVSACAPLLAVAVPSYLIVVFMDPAPPSLSDTSWD